MGSPASKADQTNLNTLGIASTFQSFLAPHDQKDGNRMDLYDLVEPADLQTYGLIPEFIGRLPVVANLRPLNEDDLVRFSLCNPKIH